jgi:ribosomal-protein-alanine N-acetyltransferase
LTGSAFHIPTLRTERLVLRAPSMADVPAYVAYRASERSRIVGGPYGEVASFQHLAGCIGQWALRGYGRWIVADPETDAAMGLVGIFHPVGWPEPEIGWTVFDGFEGKGYALEAALATRAYAYDTLGWTRIVSTIGPENTRSIALAQRMGAVCEGEIPHPEKGTLTVWRHLGPEAA